LALSTFYGMIASLPAFDGPLDESLERSITYAVANLDFVELGTLELIPVYGPRRAYANWRKRRRQNASVCQQASLPAGESDADRSGDCF